MYLKSIEMQGFKSFADKTQVVFDKGVTAVVGPNGSGKSNITESLRWALGESSAKSLRGGKMPDVIFAGTEVRKALNYAEVAVTLDNSDGFIAGASETIRVADGIRDFRLQQELFGTAVEFGAPMPRNRRRPPKSLSSFLPATRWR